ncbi:MAG: energy-coupling factor transporter transmembrane protein EcfT, partial [Albidovulum sp.]|nr:energy-coupling factor transporter transmembrane protein EcfT [Albidovulum sp.]
MISLISPVKTRFHDVPAGPKLLVLCFFTAVLFSADSAATHVSAVAVVGLLYILAGSRFLIAG